MAQSAFEEIAASTDRVSALDRLRAGTTVNGDGSHGISGDGSRTYGKQTWG